MPFESSMDLLRFAGRCSRLFVIDHSGVLRSMARASIDGQIAILVSASCHSKFNGCITVWAELCRPPVGFVEFWYFVQPECSPASRRAEERECSVIVLFGVDVGVELRFRRSRFFRLPDPVVANMVAAGLTSCVSHPVPRGCLKVSHLRAP